MINDQSIPDLDAVSAEFRIAVQSGDTVYYGFRDDRKADGEQHYGALLPAGPNPVLGKAEFIHTAKGQISTFQIYGGKMYVLKNFLQLCAPVH